MAGRRRHRADFGAVRLQPPQPRQCHSGGSTDAPSQFAIAQHFRFRNSPGRRQSAVGSPRPRQRIFGQRHSAQKSQQGNPVRLRLRVRLGLSNLIQNVKTKVIYDDLVTILLDGVMDGYNATVLAYGATGCGKTYTYVLGEEE